MTSLATSPTTTSTEKPMQRHRLAVMASGRGSNLGALLERRDRLAADFVCVVSNRDAPALDIGRNAGLQAFHVPARKGEPREDHEQRIMDTLRSCEVSFVVLAGYMRILSTSFVEQWAGRLVNIHPSLLPAFPGLDTHRAALERGVKLAGATVHFVTPGPVDGGPIIAQRSVPVYAADSEDALASRILGVEHELYADALADIFSGRLVLEGDRVIEKASAGR